MSRPAEIARFFWVTAPGHPFIPWAFLATFVAAIPVLAAGRPAGAGVLAPVFLVQALAVSSGFIGPARRGHYDLLFTGGHARTVIAVVHWAMSAGPGIVCWLSIALVERLFVAVPLALTSGTLAGMAIVSTLPWSASVPASRLAAGLAAILLVVMAMGMLPADLRDQVIHGPWRGAGDTLLRTVAVLVCPWLLAGRPLGSGDLLPVAGAAALGAGAFAAALVWIGRVDIRLQATQ